MDKRIKQWAVLFIVCGGLLGNNEIVHAVPTVEKFKSSLFQLAKQSKRMYKKHTSYFEVIATLLFLGLLYGVAIGTFSFYLIKKEKNKKLLSMIDNGPLLDDSTAVASVSHTDSSMYHIDVSSTQPNKEVFNALKAAVFCRNIEQVKHSIAQGALYHENARKLLHEVPETSAEIIRYLVRNYPRQRSDLLECTLDGLTPLQKIMNTNRNPRLAEVLIELGANVHIANLQDHSTPLMLAARYKQYKIFILLVARGAHLGAFDAKGFTCIDYIDDIEAFFNVVNTYENQYPDVVAEINSWGGAKGSRKADKQRNVRR